MGKRLFIPDGGIRGMTFPKPEGHFSSSFILLLALPVLSPTIFNGTPMHRRSSRLTFTSTSHHATQPSRERPVGLEQSPTEPVAASQSTGRRRLFQASSPASDVSTYSERVSLETHLEVPAWEMLRPSSHPLPLDGKGRCI